MKIVTGRDSELCGSFVAIIKSMSYFVTGFIWTFSTLLAAYPANRQGAVAVPTHLAFSQPQGLDFQQCSLGKALPQDEDIMIEDTEGGPWVRNVTTVLGDGNRENRWGRFVLLVLVAWLSTLYKA